MASAINTDFAVYAQNSDFSLPLESAPKGVRFWLAGEPGRGPPGLSRL